MEWLGTHEQSAASSTSMSRGDGAGRPEIARTEDGVWAVREEFAGIDDLSAKRISERQQPPRRCVPWRRGERRSAFDRPEPSERTNSAHPPLHAPLPPRALSSHRGASDLSNASAFVSPRREFSQSASGAPVTVPLNDVPMNQHFLHHRKLNHATRRRIALTLLRSSLSTSRGAWVDW